MNRVGIEESFEYITNFSKDHDLTKVLSILSAFKVLLPKVNLKNFAHTHELGLYIETYARIALSQKNKCLKSSGIEFKSLCLLIRHLKNYVFLYNTQSLTTDPCTIDNIGQFLLKKNLETRYTTMRGESYEHILLNAALSFYSGIESMFKKILGFTIEDVLKVNFVIRELLIERLQQMIDSKKGIAQLKAAFEIIESGTKNPFSFTPNEIINKCQVNKDIVEKILTRLSQSAGYSNPFYPNFYVDPTTSLAEYNTIFEKPLICQNELYYVFFPEYLPSIIFNTFWYDLRSNDEFKNDFSTYCGNWVEQETAKCFRKLLPNADIILNPKKKDNNELCDVLIRYDNKLLIVQCKAKRFTLESKRGVDWNSIRKDFMKSLVDACQQGDNSIKYFQESKTSKINVQGIDLDIDISKYNKVYLVCVSGDTISFQHSRLIEICKLISENISNTPWALSLFDLLVVSEMIDNPGVFINYLNKRINISSIDIDIIGDEMDFLGWYFANGINIPPEMESEKKVDLLALDYSTEVDEFYYGFSQTKPSLHIPKTLKDAVDQISKIEINYSTDCINEVLNVFFIDGFDVSEALELCLKRTIADNARHIGSYYSVTLDTYFFVVTVSDNITVEQLYNCLQNLCFLKSVQFENNDPLITKIDAKKFVNIGKINNSSNIVDVFFYMGVFDVFTD